MTHEALVALLRGLDFQTMRTDELVAACRTEFPECRTEDVLAALYEIVDELTLRMAWMRSGSVLH